MSLETPTVLTVDDNETLRYSIRRMLVDAGFHVIEAKNGREGLEMAATLPDVIALDINLPDIDGFEVCRELKSNPLTRHIPVLHVSGTFVDPEYRVKGLQGGADAYLAEPIDRAELVATVEALLRVRSSEKRALQEAQRATTARDRITRENAELEARVRERTTELEMKSEEIRRLNVHLLKLQDDERRKIARELHDSTGQYLSVLNINLSNLRQSDQLCSADQAVVSDSLALTTEVTRQVRTMSYLLHPPLLDEAGLAAALKWYIEGFSSRSHIEVKLDIAKDFGRLDPEMEIAIFRIVQECLTNIHRHSGGEFASVELHRDPAKIILEVKDSGSKAAAGGRPPSPGTGILGMRERVRELRGQLNVSFEATGTRVKADIPVSHTESA